MGGKVIQFKGKKEIKHNKETEERIERIKKSLEKINKLMCDLKKETKNDY